MLWASLLHYKGYRNVTISEPADPRRANLAKLELNFEVLRPTELNDSGNRIFDIRIRHHKVN